MSWKETCPMTERHRFVQEALRAERSFQEICQAYGVSRPTGYKWLERFEQGGLPALADRSHARLGQERAVGPEVIELLICARLRHPHWGPRKLLAWLAAREPLRDWPASSTVGQILVRHDLVKPRMRRRRVVGANRGNLIQAYAPNVVWCTDFKGQFRTTDHRYCYPLTLTDAYSRYLLSCRGMLAPTTQGSRPCFERAFREFGLPLVMRSDNGAPFASTALAGLSQLSLWWIKLGIRPELIEPGKPQQNGRHERMHRTLKQETARKPATNLRGQQRLFDEFVRDFNEERPHEALHQHPPASIYVPSLRPYPNRLAPVEYSQDHQVRLVRSNGEIKFLGSLIYLSEVLIHEPVGLLQIDEQRWRLDYSFLPLAVLNASTMKIEPLPPSRK